jgi:hypothetical protein
VALEHPDIISAAQHSADAFDVPAGPYGRKLRDSAEEVLRSL